MTLSGPSDLSWAALIAVGGVRRKVVPGRNGADAEPSRVLSCLLPMELGSDNRVVYSVLQCN